MGLVTVQQIRDEGLDVTQVSDLRVQAAIEEWSQFVERHCRQPFLPKPRTFVFDGNNTDALFLPVPLLAVKALYINSDFVNPLPAIEYAAYIGLDYPDDRKNPKVQLITSIAGAPSTDFFRRRLRRPFVKGKQNQRLVGVFGYVDAAEPIDIIGATNASPIVVATAVAHGLATGDWVRIDDIAGNPAANYAWTVTVVDATHVQLNGSTGNGVFTLGGSLRKLTTPALIQRAVIKLVIAKSIPITASDEAQIPGPAWLEMTDGHQVQYLTPDRFRNKAITIGVTKDPEVEGILAMYRAPAKMRVTGTFQDSMGVT